MSEKKVKSKKKITYENNDNDNEINDLVGETQKLDLDDKKVDYNNNVKKVIELFNKNVLGKKPIVDDKNNKHSGKVGHWLEEKMGVKKNCSNAPDILGFEMKTGTKSKTSFGDWTPNLSGNGSVIDKWWNDETKKLIFLKKYGLFNTIKNRYSWACTTKFNNFNKLGQKLIVDDNDNIFIIYNKKYDTFFDNREIKETKDDVRIVGWSKELLTNNIHNKFGKNGYFRCELNKKGEYSNIVFGEPLYFSEWIREVKNSNIYFDSGTKEGEKRPYMTWRANNKWWKTRELKKIDF